jgi:urease accessory protein
MFDQAREMAPYLRQPPAMKAGAIGKHGYLKLVFDEDSSGKSVLRELERRVPLIVQQELYFDENMRDLPCVYILSSGGPNVDGDRYRQDITVKSRAKACVLTGASTKLAEMKYNYSGLKQNIILEEDAYLEYMPEPIIPCRHSRFISDTRIVAHESATLFYSEIFTSGRKFYSIGERFQYDVLSVCCHGERPDGHQLFREKFVITPYSQKIDRIGLMQDYDVFANVLVLTPQECADKIYDAVSVSSNSCFAEGITRLPENAGLLYKVLGVDVGQIKIKVRDFCSIVRQTVKGVPVPNEFPWR